MTRSTPGPAVELIKKWEGFQERPYLCPAGVWTVGWGSTRGLDGEPVTRGTAPVTVEQAERLLRRDLVTFEAAVSRMVRVPLTDGQYGALVSFTYNLGAGRLQSSMLLRRVNEGLFDLAAREFGKWVMAGGRRLPGLVARRADERAMFLTPDPVPEELSVPMVSAPTTGRVGRFLAAFRTAAGGAS